MWYRRVPRALLLIALLSLLPRLPYLNRSLWNDETFSTHLRLGFHRESLAWMAYDTHPPLYNVIMLFWVSVFGDSAVSIRALPLLCSVASVFWIGRLAALLVGSRPALIAAAMLALSGASIFYAQEARSYSLIILLFLVTAEALLRYERSGDGRNLRRFVLFSLLCAISHVYAFLFVLCLWGLLLLTARTPRAVTGVLRGGLVQAAVAAPFYFLIALMVLFTSEHQYLWRGLTYSFTPADAAALLSFYLFGHGGANALGWVHAAAAVLFLAGVALAAGSRPARPPEAGAADFSAPWLGRLFAAACGLGLTLSVAAVSAPWWLSPEAVQHAVGREKHPDLIAALPQLLHRTGQLYLLGYAALVAFFFAVGGPDRPGPLARLFPRVRLATSHARLDAAQAVVLLPCLAILLVMVISHFRPTYNSRYMLALLPFTVLTMSLALCRVAIPWVRAALVGLVAVTQVISLIAQEEAYSLLKPDYKGALRYVGSQGWPATGTALWELENLNRYYSGRRELAAVKIVPRPEAVRMERLVVFVPGAYPLEAPHLAELRELVRTRSTGSVAFAGLTLYEIGPRAGATAAAGQIHDSPH